MTKAKMKEKVDEWIKEAENIISLKDIPFEELQNLASKYNSGNSFEIALEKLEHCIGTEDERRAYNLYSDYCYYLGMKYLLQKFLECTNNFDL